METVKAPYPFMDPPAVPVDKMTQPMGPLEEGDQALVDAAHMLPEGQHEIRHEDGGVTWVGKSESLGQDIAVVNTITADGAHKHASTLINKISGVDGVTADLGHSTAWNQGSGSKVYVEGNRIGSDVLEMKVGTNRREAQAVKLEVANQINVAREQIEQAHADAGK